MTNNFIKSAAILFNNGSVYVGKRHNDCFANARLARVNKENMNNCIQGFITTYGMFVTREEAAVIALQSGQINKLKFSDTKLFSEDLY